MISNAADPTVDVVPQNVELFVGMSAGAADPSYSISSPGAARSLRRARRGHEKRPWGRRGFGDQAHQRPKALKTLKMTQDDS